MLFQCKGITKKNKQCKRMLKNKYYCKKHTNQYVLNLQTIPEKIIKNVYNFLDIYSKINFTMSCKYNYKTLKSIDFNINIFYNKEIINFIRSKKINFGIKSIRSDGNCGIYTIYEFLRNKDDKITIKFLQFLIKKYINNDYRNEQWIEMLDIVKVLDCFNFGVIFKIISFNSNDLYIGYNIKKKYEDNCFINYIENLHFDLLIPYKNHEISINEYLDKENIVYDIFT